MLMPFQDCKIHVNLIMHKGRIPLVILCFVCMAGLLGLQVYWIQKYYLITQANFDKEVNLAFEDALKKEFSLRCDTIEKLIANKLMDTAEAVISSKLDRQGRYIYTFADKSNVKDVSNSVSFSQINVPLIAGDTINKRKVAVLFAQAMRSSDLENHIIYYRTQNIGKYMNDQIKKHDFDTTSLRRVYDHYLKERQISIPYQFYLAKKDSTTNKSTFSAKTLTAYPVITKAFPTYKRDSNWNFVRARFKDPFAYVLANMLVIFSSSVLLIVLIACCLIYLLKTLFKEKKLSAVRNDFISNITHEFKTPIATISAAVEALTSFNVLNDTEKTQRYLGHARTELSRLSGLVDQVLNIAIYSNQDGNLVKEPVELSRVIHELIDSHSLSKSKTIRFFYENKDLQFTVMANRIQFYHSLNNVIDNAIKYSGERPDITLQSKIKNGFLLICIGDAGTGISSSDLPLVFDQFYRSPDVIRKRVKGYGLGLNYVKSIMDNHNGWCKIESEPGKGSKVTLAWPV